MAMTLDFNAPADMELTPLGSSSTDPPTFSARASSITSVGSAGSAGAAASSTGRRRSFTKGLNKTQNAADIRKSIAIVYSEPTSPVGEAPGFVETILEQEGDNDDEHMYSYEVPDYESQLEENRGVIEADSLRSMLLFPADDVKLVTVPRKLRTTSSSVPDEARQTSQSLFAKSCVDFYTADWTVLERASSEYNVNSADLPSLDEIDDPTFEVDTSNRTGTARESLSQGLYLRELSTEPFAEGYLLYAKLSATATRGKKEIPSSKWKRRFFVLKFETGEGPLRLEGYKDDKKSAVKDVIVMPLETEVEVLPNQPGSFRLLIEGSTDLHVFNAEAEDTCTTWATAVLATLGEWKELQDTIDHPESNKCFSRSQSDMSMRETMSDVIVTNAAGKKAYREREAECRNAMSANLFRFYAAARDAPLTAGTFATEIPKPFDETPHLGFQFQVSCLELSMQMSLTRGSRQCNPEPFFGSLCLYDVKRGARLSENFYFDLNDPEQGFWVNDTPLDALDAASKSREAVFSVAERSPDVYLVLFVEKVLQGDLATVVDAYIKGADNEKAAEKQAKSAALCLAKLGSLRMPFAFAGKPVFQVDGELDPSEDMVLYRQEIEHLNEEDLLKALGDLQKTPAAKLKLIPIPGRFRVIVRPPPAGKPTITASLTPAGSVPMGHDEVPRREVLGFPLDTVRAPFVTYQAFLYVYPLSVNFTAKKVSTHNKARNIACRVELLETDAAPLSKPPSGLKCIFGKSSQPLLVNHTTTAVSHHCKSPDFYEEVKIMLPVNITEKHHLLFTFYHVSIDQTKKKKENANRESPIGYAFVPLLNGGKQLDGELELSVASAGQSYDGLLLPPNYTKANAASEADSQPKLRWIEGGKPLFRLRTKTRSTVYSEDDHVNRFFAASDTPDVSPTELCVRVKALHALTPDTLYGFMPVLFNRLLASLAVHGAKDQVGVNVVRYLVHAVRIFHEDEKDVQRNALLRSYVHYVFVAPDTRDRTVHQELVRTMNRLFEHPDAAQTGIAQVANDLLRHLWFFLDLVTKSMAQHVQRFQTATSSASPLNSRSRRFPKGFQEDVMKLVILIVEEMKKRVRVDLSIVQIANATLASFMNDCFALMDRGFCFKLTKTFLQRVSTRPTPDMMIVCKFEFLRTICNYEHYVALNLPMKSGVSKEEATSPLSSASFGRHFLASVLLHEVQDQVENGDPNQRATAISVLRNLLAKHDFDDRYAEPLQRARIAQMYFPVLHMVLDNVRRMSDHAMDGIMQQDADTDEVEPQLSFGETQDLLMCFLYVLKNIDRSTLTFWWGVHGFPLPMFDVMVRCVKAFKYQGRQTIANSISGPNASASAAAVKRLLELEYSAEGNKRRSTVGEGGHVAKDWRSKRKNSTVEIHRAPSTSAGLGSGRITPPFPRHSALERTSTMASMFESRHASTGSLIRPGASTTVSLRPTSTTSQSRYFRYIEKTAAKPDQIKLAARVEGHLASETVLVLIEVLELFLDRFPELVEHNDGANNVTQKVIELMRAIMGSSPSAVVVKHLSAAIVSFVHKYNTAVFNPNTNFCQELCLEALRMCNSSLSVVRNHACLILYTLLRENVHRMTLHVTIALSKLAGDSYDKSDEFLQTSLTTLGSYVKQDRDPPGVPGFGMKVSALMERLRIVLVDTEQMKQFQSDPEMLIDLQYRIMRSYSKSPELHVTWLESMAEIHIKQKNWAEASMCVLHAVAVVLEQLKYGTSSQFPAGALTLASLIPNVRQEEYLHEDQAHREQTDVPATPLFSQKGLLRLVDVAVALLKKAQLQELVSSVYALSIPILERERRFEKLALACGDMQGCFEAIVQLNRTQRRRLGTYFRVGFYGLPFEELNGKEFIYKEPNVTPLSEISLRLKGLFSERFGAGKVQMITDSNKVEAASLANSPLAHLQITFVEPYFETEDAEVRLTYFEKNHHISKFIFETPFTLSGKPHGNIAEQCKRKTILHVQPGFSFPYVKKRLLIHSHHDEVLQPIDVAIEEMSKKVNALRDVVSVPPERADMKLLQMQLSGMLNAQVHGGPLEYVAVFLAKEREYEPRRVAALKASFKTMMSLLQEGLLLNQKLIKADQRETQEYLQAQLVQMRQKLSEYLPEMRPTEKFSSLLKSISSGISRQGDIGEREPEVKFLSDVDGI
eukprot:m.184994 g.184994  ORF g.184994 m.184994 type:complete len:2151 (-) comp18109_c0_seq2:114-6566(-)